MTSNTELARWLLDRARTIGAECKTATREIAAVEHHLHPAHAAGIRTEIAKSYDHGRHLAEAAGALIDLELRLDSALERLSDVIYLEALLKHTRGLGLDLTDKVTHWLEEANTATTKGPA